MAAEVKPGWKTTEFWLSTVAVLLGIIMASGALNVLPENSWIVQLIGGVISVLSTMGYTAGRAKVKSNGGTETPAA